MNARAGFTPNEFYGRTPPTLKFFCRKKQGLFSLLEKTRTGFTLIELLITMGVMTLISAMVFFNFPKLNQEVLMNRAARELASAIRDAQARAIAVTQLPGAAAGEFPDNYGVHVAIGPTFQLFSDGYDANPVDSIVVEKNKKYDSTAPQACDNECVKQYTLLRGIRINDIRDTTSTSLTDGMNIIFKRPEPKTIITKSDAECVGGCAGGPYGPFHIQIESADGQIHRTIILWTTGQVAIRNS